MTAREAVEAAHRSDWARIVAGLIRLTHDWALAEDATADAFATALHRWPLDGVPPNPPAWLATTARRRAIDLLRRAAVERTKVPEQEQEPADDRLSLVFTCCHPALPTEAQVALTLRTVAGLTVEQIAAAFLVPETTMAQRLTRARKKITNAGIPYRVPSPEQWPERLAAVLAVVYLIFNQGYSADGDRRLADEAVALAEQLDTLMPTEDEVHGLLALLLFQHSRRDARRGPDGTLLTIAEQDRTNWHRADIDRALTVLRRARTDGPYRVQAEIAACHASAPTPDDTDWRRIVSLYDALEPSPVVVFNRAIAVGMRDGPDAGLAALKQVDLPGFRLLPAARAEFLARAGRIGEAVAHYEHALALSRDADERAQLRRRIGQLTES